MTVSSSISYILAKVPTPKKYISSLRKSFGMAYERPSKCGGTTLCDFLKYRATYLLLFLCAQSAVTKSFIMKLYILWFSNSSVKRIIKNYFVTYTKTGNPWTNDANWTYISCQGLLLDDLCAFNLLSVPRGSIHCVKSVQIRSFFRSVFCCIRTEYRKIRTRKNHAFGHFSRSDIYSAFSSIRNECGDFTAILK